MGLIEDWKTSYKLWSVRIAAVSLVALELYQQLPQLQGMISDTAYHRISQLCIVLIVVGRLIKQQTPDEPK